MTLKACHASVWHGTALLEVSITAAAATTMAMAAAQAQFWAPAAAAAGVSLVMAYLNGVAIPDLLSLRTLIAKCVQLSLLGFFAYQALLWNNVGFPLWTWGLAI